MICFSTVPIRQFATWMLFVLFCLFMFSCKESDNSTDDNEDVSLDDAGISSGAEVAVSNSNARACDMLFEETNGTKVMRIDLSDTVRGSFELRSPRVAVSIINKSDGAFLGQPIGFTLKDGSNAEETAKPRIVSAVCYDRLGNPLENPGIEIE